LCDNRRSQAGNVLEHINAFRRHSRHDVTMLNPVSLRRPTLLDLDRFDAVVVHYTLVANLDNYLPPRVRAKLAAYGGLKVQFLQDEYRWVDEVTATTRMLGIQLLYSLVPQDEVPAIYGERIPDTEVRTTLAGFVPSEKVDRFRRPLRDRSLDVAYRGRSVPFWLGRLGQDKVAIGQGLVERATGSSLRFDVSWNESDRIYGDDWYAFLGSARTTLGTESGASIVDFDGSIERRTNAYLTEHPDASFEDVEQAVLSPFEGKAGIRVISPRAFEAAVLRTAMVNFHGHYSGILEPWRHYIPLNRDFSNFAEVVDAINDSSAVEEMTERTYEEIIASGAWSLQRFIAAFDDDVERLATGRSRTTGLGRVELALAASAMRETRDRALEAARRRTDEKLVASLIDSDPALMAVRTAACELNWKSRELRRLDEDLARFALVLAARRGDLDIVGPTFTVEILRVNHGADVLLVSRPNDAAEPDLARMRAATIGATSAGRFQSIRWNHSPFGQTITLRKGGLFARGLTVGYDVVYGAHRFTALAKLARESPNAVIPALQLLFAPAQPIPEPMFSLWAFVRASPVAVVKRLFALLEAVAFERPLRRLLLGHLARRGRSSISPVLLMAELAKLRVIHDGRRALLPGGRAVYVETSYDPDTRTGVIKTTALPQTATKGVLALPWAGELARLIWDNSSLGTEIALPRGSQRIILPTDGRYEFRALIALSPKLDGALTAALVYALESGR